MCGFQADPSPVKDVISSEMYGRTGPPKGRQITAPYRPATKKISGYGIASKF